MGYQLEVPAELAEQILVRHGSRIYIVSKRDWDRVRRVGKKNKKIYEELKALGVKLTTVVIRKRDGSIVKDPLSRKRKRQ
jgi:hypothetical protein